MYMKVARFYRFREINTDMHQIKHSMMASFIALIFWFLDSFIHYFVYGELHFEVIPDDFNELWMRALIVVLLVSFGVYADYSTRKLLIKEKQLEATRIYESMRYASQHILNNLLNQMLLFKLEAMKSQDFDKEILALYDHAIEEAQDLIQRLSAVEHITDENIWASVDPSKLALLSRSQHSDEQKNS